jgi:hypothetical protein
MPSHLGLYPITYFMAESGLARFVSNCIRSGMDNVCSNEWIRVNFDHGVMQLPRQLSRLLRTVDSNDRRICNVGMRQKNAFQFGWGNCQTSYLLWINLRTKSFAYLGNPDDCSV